MTEKTNNKQKNKKIVLALVWNLRLVICHLFVIWCLGFVILDTKLQGRSRYLGLPQGGTGLAQRIRLFRTK